MMNSRALAIRQERQQAAQRTELEKQTLLLIAIAEKVGVNVREVLSGGGMPELSAPADEEPKAKSGKK